MPNFIANAVLYVWGALVTSMPVWAPTVASAIGWAVTIAGAVTLGRGLSKGRLPTNSLNSNSPLQLSRDPTPVRRIIYGETRVSGPMFFAHTNGADNANLHLIVGLCDGESEAIGDVYLNNAIETLDVDGNSTGLHAGFARVKKHLGAADQVADATLLADAGGAWGETDRLQGITYIYLRTIWSQKVWPGGLPNPSAVVKGRKIYDPRTETTAWSDNPALCVRDYLTNTRFGLGIPADELDEASFIAAANICDELVGLAGGGTEKRYTCNGSFETSAEPGSVLEKLVESMAGMLTYVGGKWIVYAGAHRTPTVTLDEDDLRGAISVQTRASLRETCNGVKGTFSSPANKWQPDDFPPVQDDSFLDEDEGEEIWRDIDLPFTTSPTMAMRLAKIALWRVRDDMTVDYPAKLSGLRCKPGSVIQVNNTRYGFAAKQFLVTGLKLNVYDTDGGVALGVDLVLQSTKAANWSWSTGEEILYSAGTVTSLADPRAVNAPAGLALGTSNFKQADGTILPRLQVDWDSPGNVFVTRGGVVVIEYKRHADADWINWTGAQPGDATRDYITDVVAGVEYDVRIKFINVYGVESDWAEEGPEEVSTDTTAPDVPTGLQAKAVPGGVDVDWADSDDPSVRKFRVYRSESDDFGTASLVWAGRASSWTDYLVASMTTYYYWVTAVDGVNNESEPGDSDSASPDPATGNYFDIRFKRAATVPTTPTGSNPAGWTDAPPAEDGNPLWMSRAQKTAAGVLVGTWSDPVRITGENGVDGDPGADGDDGESIQVQYSNSDSGGWHDPPFVVGDLYMRQRVGAGAWSIAIRIVGETGPAGSGPVYGLTLYGHPSGLGTPAAGPVTTYHAAGSVVALNASGNVSGDNFLQWSGGSFDLGKVQDPYNPSTYVEMLKDITLYADYDT